MEKLIVGIGGVTNGGKTTLACKLKKALPNSILLCQDTFFKPVNEVEVGEDGFQQYDVITALDMEAMMNTVYAWMENTTAMHVEQKAPILSEKKGPNILLVEGFLLYNYNSRVYDPPDPPGNFDGHVWPMYLRNRNKMEEKVADIIYLDGTNSPDALFARVYENILKEVQKLQDCC
ncbi:nicotinamide riboside kinase 1-like isoform X2 [Scyliorhinus canicula]|uniref:nicotinamide riboside kinase 1-like isoform X2 n=1 Tax=Scyliorhinus canicula TaxID=7830 RepID=UPI0018F76331|nr:nicotinamide riboside kinase 1-like isoform X2 [Scyliorhinus canicula]